MFLKWCIFLNPLRILTLILSIWACSVSLSWAQTDILPKNVLILHSHDLGLPAYEKIQNGLERSLLAGGIQRENLFVEFMDLGRNPGPDHRALLNALLRKRYSQRRIDLIITTYASAANFMLNEGKDFFPNVPMIAMLGPENLNGAEAGRPVMLVPGRMDMLGTLKSALDLFPNTQRVLVIHGPSGLDKRYETQARREFAALGGKLEFQYLSNLPLEEILQKVADQPPQTVIMYLNFTHDVTGRFFTPMSVLERISQAANVPVFGLYDTLIEHGIVGGSILSFQAEGSRVGELALSILKGKVPVELPQSNVSTPKFIFDWKQLTRWGLSEARLPADSIVINWPDSIWARYKAAILGTFGFILVLCLAIIILFLNVLRRKQAEEALRESEDIFKHVFESANVGKSITLPTGEITVNKAFAELLGYNQEELLKKKWQELTPPDEIETIQNLIDQILNGERDSARFIKRYMHKNGSHVWADVSVVMRRDADGQPFHFITTIVDITEHMRAEEALKESESLFSQMFEQSTTSMCLYNPDGTVNRVNNEFCKMFGVEEKVIINVGYNVFKDQATIDAGVISLLKEIFHEKKKKHWETIFDIDVASTSTGTPTSRTGKIFIEVFGYPVLNREGNLEYVVLQHYDITERKQAETALRDSENKLRATLDAAAFPVVIVDSNDDKVYFWSQSAVSLFGHTAPTASEWYQIAYPDPDYRRQVIDRWKPFLEIARKSGQPVNTGEYQVTCKDGSVRMCEIYATFLPDNLIVTFNDITTRKQLEGQLQQSQKIEAIGTLAGGIAHDFNNILGIILGNTELAMDDVPKWNPARQNLDEVKRACLRAKDVIRQILSFSRKSEAEQKPINIVTVVTESLKLLRASIPTSIDIRQNISTDVHDILGDPTQIHQIMMNLCSNAAHAMEDDGGTLNVVLENTEIDEDTASRYPELNPGLYVHLRVSDTGDGISPEVIDKVFDPYFTTKDVGKGTGLGLSVVHGIVNSHHGRISVESEAGKGTTFNILFPAVEGKTRDEPKEFQELPTGKERILFVDDEESMVNLNQQRLERLGYKVIPRTDPTEALEFFRANPDQIDLVITDMTMPRMTGDRLAEEVLKIRSDMRIIICTGYSQRMSEDKAQKFGIRKYIEKPIEMENLARSVRKVLDG